VSAPATTQTPIIVTVPFNTGASGADAGNNSTAVISGVLVSALLLMICLMALMVAWFKRRRSEPVNDERDAYDNPM
jgi:hypothetical protein